MEAKIMVHCDDVSKEDLYLFLQAIRGWEAPDSGKKTARISIETSPRMAIEEMRELVGRLTPAIVEEVILKSQPRPKVRELRLGPRLLIIKGKPLGTCDGLSLNIAEATDQEIEELRSANEISLVKMAKG